MASASFRLVLGLALFFVSSVFAADYVEGQLIVRVPAGTSPEEAAEILDAQNYIVDKALIPDMGVYLVKLKGGLTVAKAVTQLRRMNSVVYAQPDHIITFRETTPNDTDFSKQWALNNSGPANIGALRAWDLGTGGKDQKGNDIVVAIVDGGVDLRQKDIAPNVWTNLGEVPGNGIDDDENGYKDDVNGWNAFSNNGTIPADRHGTHVAGIAGASGNNSRQTVGINWNVKIMSVAAASGTTSVVAAGYGYVLAQKKLYLASQGRKGANVVVTNSSFGVDFADCASGEFPIWNDLYNAMGKVGILSAVATANLNIDVDARGDVPTGCKSEFLIKVTNTDKNDKRNPNAAYGKTMIEIGAPGTDIYSTLPNDMAGNLTGTSMATPHITGAVAFLHSVGSPDLGSLVMANPEMAARVVKKVLLDNVDPNASLKDITVTGGRLNLDRAAHAIHDYKAE